MALCPAHLALLSPPPWPPSHDNLRAAYQDALTSTLHQLTDAIRGATVGARLDIALPVPILHEHLTAPRGALFPVVQSLVASIYKIICTTAARDNLNVEDAEGIDPRILLVAHPRDETRLTSTESLNPIGPVISLKALVQAGRQWQSVFAQEGEQGDRLLREFTTMQENRVRVRRIPQGTFDQPHSETVREDVETRIHLSIAVGGTWDHIHIGHKLLLTMFAFLAQPQQEQPPVLTIGVTGDELLKNKKHPELLESWHERRLAVRIFLSDILDFRPPTTHSVKEQELWNPGANGHCVLFDIGSSLRLNLVEIGDPFGPTITDQSISALVLSAETRSGGKAVNSKRSEAGWHDLEVFEVEVLDALEGSESGEGDAFQAKLSSTAIRQSISDKGKLRSKA